MSLLPAPSKPSPQIPPPQTQLFHHFVIIQSGGLRYSVPTPNFNFKNEILDISTAAIAETHPGLLDLAKNGTLVMIKKSQYGPVPPWRSEFVEPEAIWIIGTNHISRESSSDVERVISAVRPDNVVVELCRSRQFPPSVMKLGNLLCGSICFYANFSAEKPSVIVKCLMEENMGSVRKLFFRAGIMYTPENGDQNQQLRSSMFSLSGQTALALRLLLATFSSKVSSDTNRPFGDEFRAARKASEEIGAQLVLGILERAWSSLKWKEKLSLVTSVIRGITSSDLSNKAIESHLISYLIILILMVAVILWQGYHHGPSRINIVEPSAGDSSFQLYEQLSFSYPSLLPPLIYERDTFLAWSLKRSKAVNNSKKVVGVIGKGHMNGVIYSLMSDTGNLRFRDLAGKRPGNNYGWAGSIAKDLLRDTIIGVLLWLVYEQFKPMS
ncbi:hypothetical protein DH2020_030938 [Rehmannia glutinosa]|uniref:TraB domain-containing protein n=1 Tax=Rehmannia glutinosa TaxID=99300 RepID=A0ABR0VM95_REHGL